MKTSLFWTTCLSFCLSSLFWISTARAQTELVRSDFFPADLEFKELLRIRPGSGDATGGPVPFVSQSQIFREVGYQHYARRSYDTDGGGELSVEVVTANDERAAFSLLTLLPKTEIAPGPPGEYFSRSGDSIVFAKGNLWVRVWGASQADLLRRVAVSVSNRIGPRQSSIPSLISHFPRAGLDSSSSKYFLGPKSFEAFAMKVPGLQIEFRPEMEIAQAAYLLKNRSGILTLANFPTAQMAGDYFEGLSEKIQPAASRVYTRRVGPLIGILDGDFDPVTADQILGDIKFSYSIRWIYDKNNRSSSTVWGVPVGILGTVVRSLLLTVLLCGMSVLLGISMAIFRIFLRGYAPGNFLDAPERTEMIRLRLNEDRHSSSHIAAGKLPTETK